VYTAGSEVVEMTETEGRMLADTHKAVSQLMAVVVGMNGTPGLIGTAKDTAVGVADIQRTIPTLATKAECVDHREKCVARTGQSVDRKWMRTKDFFLVSTALIMAALAFAARFWPRH
jgi:hypothetical protein